MVRLWPARVLLTLGRRTDVSATRSSRIAVPRRLLALWCLAALAAAAGCSGQAADRRHDPRRAPDVVLSTLDGGQVRLSDLRGRVVLLHFWATWCGPCKESMAHEVRLQERYGPEGLRVVGVSVDRKPSDVEAFLARRPVNYPIALADDEVKQAFGGVSTIPYTVYIDRQGRVRKRKVGFAAGDEEAMERFVRLLLAEGAGEPYGA